MIYGFSFSNFELLILAHMLIGIHHHQPLEFVGSSNLSPKVPEFWYPIARI